MPASNHLVLDSYLVLKEFKSFWRSCILDYILKTLLRRKMGSGQLRLTKFWKLLVFMVIV